MTDTADVVLLNFFKIQKSDIIVIFRNLSSMSSFTPGKHQVPFEECQISGFECERDLRVKNLRYLSFRELLQWISQEQLC